MKKNLGDKKLAPLSQELAGIGFVVFKLMDKRISTSANTSKKFQVPIGEKIAYVEIISLPNHICSVEIPGRELMFITKIKDKDNKPCWISLPQGNDELAMAVGNYIEAELYPKTR